MLCWIPETKFESLMFYALNLFKIFNFWWIYYSLIDLSSYKISSPSDISSPVFLFTQVLSRIIKLSLSLFLTWEAYTFWVYFQPFSTLIWLYFGPITHRNFCGPTPSCNSWYQSKLIQIRSCFTVSYCEATTFYQYRDLLPSRSEGFIRAKLNEVTNEIATIEWKMFDQSYELQYYPRMSLIPNDKRDLLNQRLQDFHMQHIHSEMIASKE